MPFLVVLGTYKLEIIIPCNFRFRRTGFEIFSYPVSKYPRKWSFRPTGQFWPNSEPVAPKSPTMGAYNSIPIRDRDLWFETQLEYDPTIRFINKVKIDPLP